MKNVDEVYETLKQVTFDIEIQLHWVFGSKSTLSSARTFFFDCWMHIMVFSTEMVNRVQII